MIINHPILGPRDAQEFVYLGDANLMNRPDGMTAGIEVFHDYLYNRDNRRGPLREQWWHVHGCRRWLVVERDTQTNEILSVRDSESAG